MVPTKNGEASVDMSGVFKSSPNAHVMKNLLTDYRTKARTHLQETMPGKIETIRGLLATENDPDSAFWVGHVDTPEWQPQLYQPDSEVADGGVVTPDQVVRATVERAEGEGTSTPDDHDNDDTSKGVRVGPHWFEVVPINETQDRLIKVSLKEHEDLHMIVQDLKIWLELEIPLIEDGNSFGADVQNVLIRELTEAYKRSNGFQNGARSHYHDRLKLTQDWVKYPNLRDFPVAIAASDRFDHILMRSYLRSLLVIYGGLLTKFERNWEKVINPKGSSARGGMY